MIIFLDGKVGERGKMFSQFSNWAPSRSPDRISCRIGPMMSTRCSAMRLRNSRTTLVSTRAALRSPLPKQSLSLEMKRQPYGISGYRTDVMPRARGNEKATARRKIYGFGTKDGVI